MAPPPPLQTLLRCAPTHLRAVAVAGLWSRGSRQWPPGCEGCRVEHEGSVAIMPPPNLRLQDPSCCLPCRRDAGLNLPHVAAQAGRGAETISAMVCGVLRNRGSARIQSTRQTVAHVVTDQGSCPARQAAAHPPSQRALQLSSRLPMWMGTVEGWVVGVTGQTLSAGSRQWLPLRTAMRQCNTIRRAGVQHCFRGWHPPAQRLAHVHLARAAVAGATVCRRSKREAGFYDKETGPVYELPV